MNWENFQLNAYTLTEKDVVNLTKEIVKVYEVALKGIISKMEKAYAQVLANVNKDEYYAKMIQYNRLNKIFMQMTKEYSQAAAKFNKLIIEAGNLAFSNTFYRKLYAGNWLDPTLGSAVVPQSLIDISVLGTEGAFKNYKASVLGKGIDYMPKRGTLSELLKLNKERTLIALRNGITSGLQQGMSVRNIINEIKSVLGMANIKDDVFTSNGNLSNLLRIVRTETTRVMNDGNYASSLYAQSKGINIKKMWLATLDMKTRPVHAELDSDTQEIEKFFESGAGLVMRPGQFSNVGQNANCRCTIIDIINDEKPSIRMGTNPDTGKTETFSYKSFDQWAKDNNIVKTKTGKFVKKT